MRVVAVSLGFLAIGTIWYFDASLPRVATVERVYKIKNKKGPPVFGTASEFRLYQTAYYAALGSIALGFVSIAIAIRLTSKNENRA